MVREHLDVSCLRAAMFTLRAGHAAEAAEGGYEVEISLLWVERTHGCIAQQIVQKPPLRRVDFEASAQIAQPRTQPEGLSTEVDGKRLVHVDGQR